METRESLSLPHPSRIPRKSVTSAVYEQERPSIDYCIIPVEYIFHCDFIQYLFFAVIRAREIINAREGGNGAGVITVAVENARKRL